MVRRLLPTTALVCLAAACGGQSSPTPAPGPVPTGPVPVETTAVLVGAGDIAKCGSAGTIGTAKLLDGIPGTVFTVGDNVYDHGTAREYSDCYGPSWGRHRSRTRPVPGNHEYETPGAAPYFSYFGGAAGPEGLGYYSYHAGTWLVLALNSETNMRPGSAQNGWLRSELQHFAGPCQIAYFHRPLFSSGPNGNQPDVKPLWDVLYEFGVDIIVQGHDHIYERYARQDPSGRPDTNRGIRSFVVGTGGGDKYHFLRTSPTSEVRGTDFGVLKLTLSPGHFNWDFIPVEGGTFRDSGAGACR